MNIENQIICGDALDVLKTLPDECVDLTVTSPPYDNLRDYEGYSFDFERIAQELHRITKCGGVVVWVVGDATVKGSETGTSFKQALYFKEIGFNLHDTMIYQKNSAPFPDKVRYNAVFEYMFVFSKGVPNTVSLIKDRKNRWEKSFGKSSNRQKDGKLKQKDAITVNEYGTRDNIWKYNTGFGYTTEDKYAHEHPAMFPEKLAQDHIVSWSNEGDLVLDPMNGSGTTTKCAKYLGRRFIGIDISPNYCKLANDRLSQEMLF